ncbi:MAG TPA: hypothetical protein DD417_17285 [Elusimicrobia bacterium]|nr:hypothetical protein [Elusimicrobiota bacterium]
MGRISSRPLTAPGIVPMPTRPVSLEMANASPAGVVSRRPPMEMSCVPSTVSAILAKGTLRTGSRGASVTGGTSLMTSSMNFVVPWRR